MSKNKVFIVAAILVLGFLVRLYRVNNPLADWHSWRQSDTAAVSKIYAKQGINPLKPQYFDISNIQTGKNNPEGLRLVEFPIFSIIHASLYSVFGFMSLETLGRLISIACSCISALCLYFLVSKYINSRAAIATLIVYLFLPFSIYYGRVILPDTMMTTASLLGIYFFDLYATSKKNKYYFLILSTIFTASSFLLKPFAIFFTLPQLIIAWYHFKAKLFLKPELWGHLILSFAPLIWWRAYIQNFPEGIPVSDWLFNGNGIRFRPSFFRWIIYERLTKLILGYVGVILVLEGLWQLSKTKKFLFPLSFILSSVLYITIIATGNVQHDYYQILILPTIAILFGIGMDGLIGLFGKKYEKVGVGICVVLFLATIFLSGNLVKDYFNINNEALVVAGKKADEVLPKDAKVIAPYNGDTTLLYYINRKGWPALQDNIDNLKKLGATHMVIISPTQSDFDGFGKEYEVVASDSKYLILKL